MIDFEALHNALSRGPLERWLPGLKKQLSSAFHHGRDGRLPLWQNALKALPALTPSQVDLNADAVRVGHSRDCDDETRERLEELLRQLHPWRKGPFDIFGIHIDTEWRSHLKWARLSSHVEPLAGRRILDVGCGNGYHCWRMAGEGAELVVGVDPYLLFVMQFLALKRYVKKQDVFVLPLGMEDIPPDLGAFDTVFSMGVLYHRRSPMDHLLDLRSCLRSGGELILETLVVEGPEGHVLVPRGRYAKMRNVWFIPSPLTLKAWLIRCGYKDVRLVDVARTTFEEQRSTSWMTFESLPQYLNPHNTLFTVEGYPAPQRGIFLARSP